LRRNCPDDEKPGGGQVQEDDPGYISEPFKSLVEAYPGAEAYLAAERVSP